MLHFLKKKPQTPEKIYSDEELVLKAKNDNYVFQKTLKQWSLMALLMVAVFIFGVFAFRAVTEPEFRNKVTDVVLGNIAGIVFYLLTILGLNLKSSK